MAEDEPREIGNLHSGEIALECRGSFVVVILDIMIHVDLFVSSLTPSLPVMSVCSAGLYKETGMEA